jgi:hypothetical protein
MTSAKRAVLVASCCAALAGLAAGIGLSRHRFSIELDPRNVLVTEFVTSADGPEIRRRGLIVYDMRIANTGWRSVTLHSASLRHEHEGRAHEVVVVPTRTTWLPDADTPSLVVDNGAERLVLSDWNDLAAALRAERELSLSSGTTIGVSAVFPLDECAQCNQGLQPEQVALCVGESSGCVATLPLELPATLKPPLAVDPIAVDF